MSFISNLLLESANIKKIISELNPVRQQAVQIFDQGPDCVTPIYNLEIYTEDLYAVPAIQPGAPLVPALKSTIQDKSIRPFPIAVSCFISADEELDFERLYQRTGDISFIQRKINGLNKLVQNTKGGMAAIAIRDGFLTWNVQSSPSANIPYKLDIGKTLTDVTITGDWGTAPTIGSITNDLELMHLKLEDQGCPDNVEYFAGETAFAALVKYVTALTNDTRIQGDVSTGTYEGKRFVNIGGYKVFNQPFRFYGADGSSTVNKAIGAKIVYAISRTPGLHETINMPIPNLNANFQSLPLFFQALRRQDGTGTDLQLYANPLYIPNYRGIVTATAVN